MRKNMLLFVLIAAVLLGSCNSGAPADGIAAVAPGDSVSQTGQTGATPTAANSAPAGLPRPLDLRGRLSGLPPRAASYANANLVKDGLDFALNLPAGHVSNSNPDGLVFTPNFAPGANDPSGLAYAMYDFTLPDYDGSPEVSYSWLSTAPASADTYVAVANWDKNSWDWVRGEDNGTVALPNFNSHFVLGGHLLACVLLTGNTPGTLTEMRIGSRVPVPALAASPPFGQAPLSVDFDASASSDADGTIVKYEWDTDLDFVFESDTGADPHLHLDYNTPGNHFLTLRVTDNKGMHETLFKQVTVVGAVNLRFGNDGVQQVRAIIPADDGNLLALVSDGQLDEASIVLTKFSPNTTVSDENVFGQRFDTNGNDFAWDAVRGPDGAIYVCGRHPRSNDGSGVSGLLMKWNQNAGLVWAKSIFILANNSEVELRGVTVSGDAIYACGRVLDPLVGRDLALALRFNLDGELIWSKDVIAAGPSRFFDIARAVPVGLGAPSLRICGVFNYGNADSDALAVAIDENGTLQNAKTWGTNLLDEQANSIAVVQGVLVPSYVTGEVSGGAIPVSFCSKVGASSIEVSSSNPEFVFATQISALDSGFGVLADLSNVTDGGGLLRLGNDLSFNGGQHFTNSPLANCRIKALCNYDGGVFVAGSEEGESVLVGANVMQTTASSVSWVDQTPSVGTPEVFSTDMSFDLTGTFFEIDRQPATEDCCVTFLP